MNFVTFVILFVYANGQLHIITVSLGTMKIVAVLPNLKHNLLYGTYQKSIIRGLRTGL